MGSLDHDRPHDQRCSTCGGGPNGEWHKPGCYLAKTFSMAKAPVEILSVSLAAIRLANGGFPDFRFPVLLPPYEGQWMVLEKPECWSVFGDKARVVAYRMERPANNVPVNPGKGCVPTERDETA